MPEQKHKRERATRIVEEAAKEPARVITPAAEYDLALRSAVIAEGTPREELVRRIVCEWLSQRAYLE